MEWDEKIPLGRHDLQNYLDRRAFGREASDLPQAKKIPLILQILSEKRKPRSNPFNT